MASLPVYNRRGEEVGKYEIDPAVLAPRISKQLLHDAAVMYQACQRQGTFKTKTRSEVAGSTRKLYRQKGTGNARAGSRRAGTRLGGGHMKAKQPRDFSYRLPRRALQAATRMAIAQKIQGNTLLVIDELSFGKPATSEMSAILKALKLAGQTTLVATAAHDGNVYKSARNIRGVTIVPVSDLNALAVLRPRRMLVTKAALDSIRDKAAK